MPSEWRHNGRGGVSNHQPHHCWLNRLFRRRSKKALKLLVTILCAGNSPVTGEFPAQMASNAENVSFDDVIMTHCHFPKVANCSKVALDCYNFTYARRVNSILLRLRPSSTWIYALLTGKIFDYLVLIACIYVMRVWYTWSVADRYCRTYVNMNLHVCSSRRPVIEWEGNYFFILQWDTNK